MKANDVLNVIGVGCLIIVVCIFVQAINYMFEYEMNTLIAVIVIIILIVGGKDYDKEDKNKDNKKDKL